ncbi:BON1-associated protein 2-like [Carex rostrata]
MATCTATSCTTNSSTLEITVISAEDLRQGCHHLGQGAFITVRSGPSVVSTTASTEDTRNYPSWNERLHIREPSHGGWIQVDVSKRKQGDASNAVHIANVKVPLSDFSYGPVGYKHFLSYRLRDQEGRGNGIVNLCVRRLEENGEKQFKGEAHAMGYPVAPVGVGYDYGYMACGEIGSAVIPKEKHGPDTLSPLSLSNPLFQGILSSI